jgi:hypothetical protein
MGSDFIQQDRGVGFEVVGYSGTTGVVISDKEIEGFIIYFRIFSKQLVQCIGAKL